METLLAQFSFSPTVAVVFAIVVVLCLVIDIKAHGKDKEITIQNAFMWSGVWIGVALLFGVFLGVAAGWDQASLFFAGYFLEKSLSVDNLFVIMAIFSSFSVHSAYQHRALYYGILGAIVLRMVFVAFGTTLAALSPWVLVGFGLFVLFTAWKMATTGESEDIVDYSNHWAVVWTKKVIPVHPKLDGHNFFHRQDGKWYATPLFLALVCVEISDVAFAFDSVPAVIAVTRDPMLVYTSNIFAILGLRSLYFLLVAAENFLVHLQKAVIGILCFIGLKMVVQATGEALHIETLHISPNISLAIVLGGLFLGIVGSLLFPKKEKVASLAEE